MHFLKRNPSTRFEPSKVSLFPTQLLSAKPHMVREERIVTKISYTTSKRFHCTRR